jgi:iron complex outermembrane receptor protein
MPVRRYRLRPLACDILLCLPLCCAVPAALADAPPAPPGERDLSMLPLETLVQVPYVTAASKFEQLISEAPSSVVVLASSDIREFGWRTLADALATLPGLYTTSDRDYSYLGARGFLRPGDYNSRFLLTIDGVRVNDPVYDQAMLGTEGLLDLDMVKRIEFVPGPGSAVYGSNAVFGVINIVTRDGSGLAGLRAALAAGSYGERRGRVSYGWHDQSGADLLLAATSYQRTGQDLYFPEFDTPNQNHGVAHRLDYDRAQNFLVKGTYGGFTLVAAYVARTKGVPTASYGAVFNMPYSTRDADANAALTWNGQFAPGVALSAQLAWGRAEYLGLGYYPKDAVPVLNVDGDHARWYGANVTATITRLAGHKIVAGVDAERDARRDQYNFDQAPYTPYLDSRAPTALRSAAFIEDEIRLPAGFLVNAGMRYDHYQHPALHRTSPRLAVLYKATPRDTVKLLAASAFRAPNAFEMYYAYPGTDGQIANPDLRRERIVTRELALEHALAGRGHATLSLYRYKMDGLINEQVDLQTGMLVYRNLDQATAHGVEAALESQFGGMRLRASYAWQVARGNDGAPLIDSPRHLAKANLVSPLPWRDARLGSELLCSSARVGLRETAGGYCVANLTVTSAHALPDAELSLSLLNAFDKRYTDIVDAAFLRETVARQGRTLYAKLEHRF